MKIIEFLKEKLNKRVLFSLGLGCLFVLFFFVVDADSATPDACFETRVITEREAEDKCITYEKSLEREKEKMKAHLLGCDGGTCIALPPERTRSIRRHTLEDIKQKYSCTQRGDVVEITRYLRDKEGCGAHVVIPNSIDGKRVVGIGQSAFALNWKKKEDPAYLKLETLRLPKGLLWVDESAFGSNLLTGTLKLPASLRYVGNWGFGNNEFTAIKFNDNLEYIGSDAFRNNNLKEVEFPKNVFFIGARSFLENDIESAVLPTEKYDEELRIESPTEVFDRSVEVIRV